MSTHRQARMQALRDRQAAMREKLRLRREKGPKKAGRARDPYWAVVVVVLLVILLVRECRPEPEPLPCVPVPGEPVEGVPVVVPVPPAPLTGTVPIRPRPTFQGNKPAPLGWIGAFRMQVAARSPRLALCFEGVARPGTLKWTTAVEPKHGVVSAHDLVPTLTTASLSTEQQACVLEVLSHPPYQLQVDEERPTPSRVSLVLEF